MRLSAVVAGLGSIGLLAPAPARLAIALAGAAASTGCESCTIGPITPAELPDGQVGHAYFLQLRAPHQGDCGWSGSTEFALAGGRMPPAMKLSKDGAIDGVPTVSGSWQFTVAATFDPGGDTYPSESEPVDYTLTIAP